MSRFSRQAASTPTHQNDLEASIDYDDMTFSDVDNAESKISARGVIRKRPVDDCKPITSSMKRANVDRLMDDNRESAQLLPISAENKGYKLLEKFGYSASQGGLGKDNSGLAVPLAVTKRAAEDRAGLGVAEMKKKIIEEKVIVESHRLEAGVKMIEGFKSDMILQQQALLSVRHLNDARKVIYELDFRSGVEDNHLWPPDKIGDESDDTDSKKTIRDVEKNQNVRVQLAESLLYLKDIYSYCVFCGCQYESREDLESSCPGPSEEDH